MRSSSSSRAAETGPRALGHRSIFANPCDPQARERLNERVKYREAIRPLAPMATLEAAMTAKAKSGPAGYAARWQLRETYEHQRHTRADGFIPNSPAEPPQVGSGESSPT